MIELDVRVGCDCLAHADDLTDALLELLGRISGQQTKLMTWILMYQPLK